jgi:tetratricopeptide (TPR) repeat protein
MSNRSKDALFQLIKSLEKAEKRNFKLFVQRNLGTADLKITQLFDAMDRAGEEYDEEALLLRVKSLKKAQLPNLKANLYRQVLASLRTLRDDGNVEIQLHEQMEYARILYNKGLYQQSLKMLERVKELAKTYHQSTFWHQALVFEKKIESLHITRSLRNRAEMLSAEVVALNDRLALVGNLSNLSLQLYSWYIHVGHARNERDVEAVREFFAARLPPNAHQVGGFFGRLYLFQAYCWQALIVQDFLLYYRYAQRWVDLFEEEPAMRRVETLFYIKGLHNLLLVHFMLRNYPKYEEVLRRFEAFSEAEEANANDNVRVQSFVYLAIARLNEHFLKGTFSEGLRLVPGIEERLAAWPMQIDQHRFLVLYYKIACLYFGAGDAGRAIQYLNRIIHQRTDLRSDLQCYARLLHLIAHYELGHFDLLQHLIKSVYRFMAQMDSLGTVEEEVFRFLRKSFQLNTPARLRSAFKLLKEKLERHERNPFESRSFMYLDLVSWLESKISGGAVQAVIRRRYEYYNRELSVKKSK